MRKTIIFPIIFILITANTLAGEFDGIGIKLGRNSSIFTGADIPGKGVKSLVGLTLGGFVNYKISKRLSLQQEAYLTTKGAKINIISDIYLSNIFMYFELPLLAKMTFRSESQLKPYFFLGPAYAATIIAFNDVAVLDDIRDSDIGIVLGGGIEVWKISLDYRLSQGLLNFDQSADNIDLKNRTCSIVVGFKCFNSSSGERQ